MDKDNDDLAMEAEMNQELEQLVPYQNPTASIDEALRLMEACPVCGNHLHATSFADFGRMLTHEVVRCDDCGYKARKEMSRLN